MSVSFRRRAISDAALQAAPATKARGYWATVGRRIARDKVSMACALILLLIFLSALLAPWLRSRRSLQGLDDPPAAPYRHGGLSARHRRTRPRHAGAADLWRAAVADHRHPAGDLRLLHRHLARPRRRLCRRQDQHRDHAHGRRVLRLSLGAAGDRDLRRARRRHRQFHRLADHRVRAADHPRRRKRHHRRAQHGFRRGGARLRRRALHHHARAHARQRAGADLRLRHRPDLGLDDPGRRPVVPRPRHQAAGAGMGPDAQHAAHRDLRQSLGGGAARRDDLRGLDLLQPAQRRHAQRHGHQGTDAP